MYNPDSVLENETLKLLWGFEIQKDHLISVRRPDQVIVNNNKKGGNLPNSGLYRSGRSLGKTERK